jgi:hypothetical protein
MSHGGGVTFWSLESILETGEEAQTHEAPSLCTLILWFPFILF